MTSIALQTPIASEIGKYHLIAELARGGMGNVYLAASQGPGGFSKLLVVKELKPELCDDQTYVTMFLEEARLAARLIHPNIVQTNEVGSDGSRHYMVMEFLDGRSLHRIGKRLSGRLSVGAHLRIIAEALLGLHHAHELREFDGEPLGIVHRDVSPLNVFVTFNGQTKVLDFGIAKAVDSSLETKMGVLKGRVAYMAPEQAKGAKVDRRADIYSAGVMLWEAAAGRRLWPGMNEVEILTRILRDGPPALRGVAPEVPEELELICARAMAFEREDRYATAAELQSELEAHLARRDDTLTMREIGPMVAEAFADERRKMNTVIEETLTRVRGGPRSGVMPTFQAQFAGTPTSANISCDGPRDVSAPLFTPSSSFAPSGSLFRASMPVTTTATLGAAVADATPLPSATKRVAILVSSAGALLLGAALLGVAARGGYSAGRSTASSAPATSPLVVVASQDDPPLIDVMLRVSPPMAQITIDGALVLSNPFRARYPKDSQIHHVTASADGYDTKLEDVTFANDVSIDMSLNRHAAAAVQVHQGAVTAPPPQARPTRHAAPQPGAANPALAGDAPGGPLSAATRPDVGPAGGRTPLRPISTSNPYGPQ
ncbi:MAG TPA: protein kinase [Polyangiaceae bacterium]|nr:protein kinase [Polyangiaceae bacterium]